MQMQRLVTGETSPWLCGLLVEDWHHAYQKKHDAK